MNENIDLKKKALAAYETSNLKQADLLKAAGGIQALQTFFLSAFGLEIKVDSNPSEIDGIRFYAETLEDADGVCGYRLAASRNCPRCGEYLTLQIGSALLDESEASVEKNFTLAMLGQWISEDHKCDFKTRVEGFRRTEDTVRP